ncbi:MAG: BglG family transcription antiterminator [Breznakia sp.]
MGNDVLQLMRLLVEETYFTVEDIMLQAKISKRQLLYRLDKLNQELQAIHADNVQVNAYNEIVVSSESKQAMIALLNEMNTCSFYFFNKEERLTYIYLMLFINREYLSLYHFRDGLQVSRSTVLSDFKALSSDLKSVGISIRYNRRNGYYLDGEEIKIRRFMMKNITYSLVSEENSNVLDMFIDAFHLDIFAYSKLMIDELSKKHQIRFVEGRLLEFIYIFIFLKARIQSGVFTPSASFVHINVKLMQSLKEYEFTNELLKHYKNTKNFSEEDINYISSWILGISFGDINEDTKDCIIISDIIAKMMMRFESLSGVHYKRQEDIFIQLYGHIRPAYYRLLFHLPIENPLSEKVKEEYKDLYKLVEQTMIPLCAIFGQEIPEGELAYLTLHFATIFAKNGGDFLDVKKTALIVCGNGIGSSAILYNELRSLFPELHFLLPQEAFNIHKVEESFDIIFTTNYFIDAIESDLPIVKVSPVMTTLERYNVVRKVHAIFNGQQTKELNIAMLITIFKKHGSIHNEEGLYHELLAYCNSVMYRGEELDEKVMALNISDLISEDHIQLQVKAKNREDAIWLSYQTMLKEQIVSEAYVEEIIKDMRRLGPYIVITKHVALPHARPEAGAQALAIGITTLKQPITFKNKENDPVKYIFSLSVVDHESHLQAMSQLAELFASTAFFACLDNARSAKEVCEYIKAQA